MKSILYKFNNNFSNAKYYYNIAQLIPYQIDFFLLIHELFFYEPMKSINLIIVFLIQNIIETLE